MLDKGQENAWFGSDLIRILAVTALLFLATFVIRGLTVKDPIVHFRLLNTGLSGPASFWSLRSALRCAEVWSCCRYSCRRCSAGLQRRREMWTSPRGIATALCMPFVGFLLGLTHHVCAEAFEIWEMSLRQPLLGRLGVGVLDTGILSDYFDTEDEGVDDWFAAGTSRVGDTTAGFESK